MEQIEYDHKQTLPNMKHRTPNPKASIYILTKGDSNFPSSRFRAFQYEPFFKRDGYRIHIEMAHKNILIRIVHFFRYRDFYILFIQKKFLHRIELALIKRLYGVIVYDFDDAMGVVSSYKDEKSRQLRRKNKQLQRMCRVADKVVCGNSTLKKLSCSSDALLLPTPYTPPEIPSLHKTFDQMSLLWIGMDATKLKLWEEALQRLNHHYALQIAVSTHKPFPPPLSFPFSYEMWSKRVEAKLLLQYNVGIMPLPDDPNSRGKSGFKIIQYMAHGLIAVASNVGFNREIIEDGIDGFICTDQEHFEAVIKNMIQGKYDLPAIQRAALKKSARFSTKNMYKTLKSYLDLNP